MKCDRCLKKVKERYKFPFLYMMNGKYEQYYGCHDCVRKEVVFRYKLDDSDRIDEVMESLKEVKK